MTQNITFDFIKTHSLMDCLREFQGVVSLNRSEKEDALSDPFRVLAQKAIYGGYFVVKSGQRVIHRVYIHTVEFYYHEEKQGGLRDWIVYHKNPFKGKPKDAFPLGTFNSHQSGVDITFEDQTPGLKNPGYRASMLIRSFRVTTGDNKDYMQFGKYPDHVKNHQFQDVEFFPTHLYDYLFMQAPIDDISISWKEDPQKYGPVYAGQRINVFDYKFKDDGSDTKSPEKDDKKLDHRKWAFSQDQLVIGHKGFEKYTFE